MIQYANFLKKRILYRRANIYLVVASILALTVMLIMNISMQDRVRDNFLEQIDILEGFSNENGMNEKQKYEALIDYYDNDEWPAFYESYQTILEENIQINENTFDAATSESSFYDDSINVIRKDLTYINYLNDHNLAYTDIEFPMIGLSFITYASGIISPILILLCCIFILAQVFTMDYAKSIDISNLFPIGRIKAFLVKLIVGIITSVLIFALILGITFLISSLINFNTGFQYPIMIQDAATNTWQAIPLTTYLKDWLLLGIVFYAGASFFTYLLSLFIKEEGPLFFTSLCIILGIAYLPMFLPEMTKIAHYLPTTYMNFVSVSTGELAMRYGNMDISFTSGIQILTLFIFVIFILSFIIKCSVIFRKTK